MTQCYRYDEDKAKYYPIFDGKFSRWLKMSLGFIRRCDGERESENTKTRTRSELEPRAAEKYTFEFFFFKKKANMTISYARDRADSGVFCV